MKKFISMLLIVCMLMPLCGIQSFAAKEGEVLFLQASHFQNNLGTWKILDETAKGATLTYCVVGTADGNPDATKAASAAIEIPESGEYTVWANTRDFTSSPGNRYCNISVNGVTLEKIVGNTKNDSWTFEKIGTVKLEKGEAIIRLLDTGAYWARVQGIVLSKDKNFVPSSITDLAKNNSAKSLDIKIPEADVSGKEEAPAVTFKDEYSYIVIAPETFEQKGEWTYTQNSDAGGYVTYYLKGISGYEESKKPATLDVSVNKDGYWRLLSLAREYTTYVGGRYFDVQIGSYPRQRLGVHGQNGWAWEASQPFPMFSGDYELKLIDASGNFARFAMLILTDDPDFMPANDAKTYEFLKENAYKKGMYTAPEKSKTPDSDRPSTDIAVKLNGKYLNFDVEPQIMNGRTMVPFRAIFENLDCIVEWNADARVAKGIRNGKAIRLTIDSKTATVDGKATALDQEAVIVDGRTLVPLRFVSEALGAAVDWNGDTRTVSIMAKIPEQVYWFDTESFTNMGSWNLVKENGSLGKYVLISQTDAVLPTDGKPNENEPATTTFSVAEEGDYYVWVRGKDYATNQPGARYFNVAINGNMIEEKFGTHGGEGYRWVKAKNKVHLTKGKNSFEVHDTSDFWARFDTAVITKSETFVPEENLTSMQAVASPIRETNESLLAFPTYATEAGTPTDSVAIENDKTKVIFYKVPTTKGQVIQNEIYSKDASGNFVLTKARDEELGFFALKADTASWKRLADTATFTTSYSTTSGTKNFYGSNPYQAGNGEWFVPVDYIADGNTVNLVFADGSYSKLSASYTLEPETESVKVSVNLTAPTDGYYTIAAWEGGSFAEPDFTDAVAPYRVIKKKVHSDVCAIPEQYMFTPMGTYTLAQNNKYGAAPVTKGIVLEPDWMPRNWAHEYDGHFAINMRSPDLNYRATVFSPILGSDDSKLQKDQTYTLEYRIISRVSDWFDSYKYIIKDLYDVTDYRQNTYATLNEAIFNTRKLMLNDFYSGWDANSIGYYNIEAMNTATDANPMQAVQDYLLSDNEEFLERRTIPHMAALLSRPGLHLNPTTDAYGVLSGWGFSEKDYDPIGSPRSGYNLNVFGGIYEMTRGNTPVMYDVGLQKGAAGVVNAYGNIAPFSNNLNMYLYTGEQKYLDEAIKQADAYLAEKVYIDHEKFDTSWDSQVYSSYYPNLGSLLDIYEVTKDKKYLDAAEFTAQMLMTSLWTSGIQNGRGKEVIEVNNYDTFWHRQLDGKDFGASGNWHGEEPFRLGYEVDANRNAKVTATLTPETVERWVPDRVGLGLEAHSTWENGSCNVVMQYWAGDFMRLADYTGETVFSDAARNAIIGRFANYSGYYITDFMTAQMKADFPYEGPDFTGIYYHHLPPFIAMLEDFLFGQVQSWSGGNITFPSLRQQGYAYFNSKQFGHKPGKFFDQADMWPWLAENTIDSGNIQIDWLAARKDGMMGIALMNESADSVTTTVSLLEGVSGGTTYTGPATVFNKDGSKETVNVNAGKFEITIPGKTLRAVTIAIPEMKAPAYAKSGYELDGSAELGATVSEHKNGKGYTLQISPEHYFAYVYITDTPKNGVNKLELTYTAGSKTETLTDDVYPFEFIIRVDDPNAEFNYSLKAEGKDYGKGTLMTRALSEQKGIKGPIQQQPVEEEVTEPTVPEVKIEYKGSGEKFEPLKLDYQRQGQADGNFRFIVAKDTIKGVPATSKELVGLTVKGELIEGSNKIPFESVIASVEERDGGLMVISVPETKEVTTVTYYSSDLNRYSFDIKIMPYTK